MSTIVIKDVLQRWRLGDAMMLENVLRFVADNIGNTLSTKKIADTMIAAGRKMDVKTVEKYLTALTQSFIIYKAPRYNVRGGQLLKTMEKYYLVDVALRRHLLVNGTTDVGRVLENVIYLELLRRHRHVFVGKMNDKEIDFIAVDQEQRAYYQVAATVRDEATLQRELTPLRKLRDSYPKTLLTLDEDAPANIEGIRRINALQWLKGE